MEHSPATTITISSDSEEEPTTSGTQAVKEEKEETPEPVQPDPLVINGEKRELDSLFTIENETSYPAKRHSTEQIDLDLTIDEILEKSEDPEGLFDMILDLVVRRTRPEGMANPHVSFSIRGEGAEAKPFYCRPTRADDLVSAVIRREMEKSAQSNQAPSPITAKKLGVAITWIDMPTGSGGGKKRTFDEMQDGDNITPVTLNELCLPASIALGFSYNSRQQPKSPWRSLRYEGKLKAAAMKLMGEVGCTKRSDYAIADIKLFQQKLPQVQIIVFDASRHRSPIFRGQFVDEDNVIGLRLKGQHFQHIKRIARFFRSDYYCGACDVLGNESRGHTKCIRRCRQCGELDARKCVGMEAIECPNCQRKFTTNSCFIKHQERGARNGQSVCELTKKCSECNMIINCERKGRELLCYHKYCSLCRDSMPDDHDTCFVAPVPPLSDKFKKRTIVFDIETRLEEKNGRPYHRPMLLIALRSCSSCEHVLLKTLDDGSSCGECGGKKLHVFSALDDIKRDVLREFVEWAFSINHKDFTVVAHNMKGYDGQFVLRYLSGKTALCPEDIILAGRKVMYLKCNGVRMVDSLNYLSMPLAAFPKNFAIDELRKGHFPHRFNVPANWSYVGKLPSLDYYLSKGMKKAARLEVEKWHKINEDENFDFRRDILSYCLSDVVLLHEGLVRFDADCFSCTRVHVFHEAKTCASAAMLVFRRNYLKKGTLAIERPETARDKASKLSKKYLSWLRHSAGLPIQDALNGGEFKVPDSPYHVDGYVAPRKAGEKATVIEIHGCFFHACLCSYSDESMIFERTGYVAPRKAGEKATVIEIHGCFFHACLCSYSVESMIFERTGYEVRCADQGRLEYLKKFYNVIVVKECEIKKMLKKDKAMKKYFEEYELEVKVPSLSPKSDMFFEGDPVDPRCFLRWRTELFMPYFLCADDEFLSYLDVCSLYPWTNKYRPYPLGRGRTVAGDTIKTPIRKGDAIPINGFVKCSVSCPRGIDVPILTMRSGGKNIVPLCAACCEKTDPYGRPCSHTSEERMLKGTWTSFELELAVEEGCVIEKVYQARHYDEWATYKKDGNNITHGIMSEYMDTLVKKKTEASGWPSESMTDEAKDEFISTFFEKEGILLDKAKMAKNATARQVAKLFANSLWGKLGERNDRRKLEIFVSPEKFFRTLTDGTKDVIEVQVLSEDKVAVYYRPREGHEEGVPTTSLASAALTTAFARCTLFELLRRIPKGRLLYCDTDSVIFVSKKGEANPLEDRMGPFLGDLTSEIPEGGRAFEFVAHAPKSYAYRYEINGEVKTVVKCKGFPLTEEATRAIRFENMKKFADCLSNALT